MTLQPLTEASFAIQLHAWAAILAFVLGGFVLFRRKGDRLHRVGGMVWVGLMVIVCVSSFFIHTIRLVGIWSPIHLLSIGTLVSMAWSIREVRRRNIVSHRSIMQWTYGGALIIAGVFTFMPGRIMYRVFFEGPQPMMGVALSIATVVGGLWLAWRGGAFSGLRRLRSARA